MDTLSSPHSLGRPMDQRARGKSGVIVVYADNVQINGVMVAKAIFARNLAIGTTIGDFIF
jgi:hypothetical protein